MNFDAAQFLQSLYPPDRIVKMSDPDTLCVEALAPSQIINPPDAVALRDAWIERAAICEIDGGMSREKAEVLAWAEVGVPT